MRASQSRYRLIPGVINQSAGDIVLFTTVSIHENRHYTNVQKHNYTKNERKEVTNSFVHRYLK